MKVGAPLKHTYISLLYFISLYRFAFHGHFCRLIEVELKGFADHVWYLLPGEPGLTGPQFWGTSSGSLFFCKCCEEWVHSLVPFVMFLGARFSQWECPESCHWLAEGPQFSHQQHPLSQKHCASFLCVHNLEMEGKVFILKDCLSSCCWWFLIRPLSKLVFFPKWCMSKALFKLCLVLKSAQTLNRPFRMSGL